MLNSLTLNNSYFILSFFKTLSLKYKKYFIEIFFYETMTYFILFHMDFQTCYFETSIKKQEQNNTKTKAI